MYIFTVIDWMLVLKKRNTSCNCLNLKKGKKGGYGQSTEIINHNYKKIGHWLFICHNLFSLYQCRNVELVKISHYDLIWCNEKPFSAYTESCTFLKVSFERHMVFNSQHIKEH